MDGALGLAIGIAVTIQFHEAVRYS
jgi:hypothetical protein